MASPYLSSLPDLWGGIGQRAMRLRLARNQTQLELATAAGVGLKALRRFERTGQGTLETLVRVAVALGVTEPLTQLFDPPVRSLAEAEAQEAAASRRRARRRS